MSYVILYVIYGWRLGFHPAIVDPPTKRSYQLHQRWRFTIYANTFYFYLVTKMPKLEQVISEWPILEKPLDSYKTTLICV